MPARLSAIRRRLLDFDVIVAEPNRGSHWMARRAGARPFPLAAHNGLRAEIDDRYITGLCRNFGIDEEEFRRGL